MRGPDNHLTQLNSHFWVCGRRGYYNPRAAIGGRGLVQILAVMGPPATTEPLANPLFSRVCALDRPYRSVQPASLAASPPAARAGTCGTPQAWLHVMISFPLFYHSSSSWALRLSLVASSSARDRCYLQLRASWCESLRTWPLGCLALNTGRRARWLTPSVGFPSQRERLCRVWESY